ncbi:acyl carrier protein [Gloeobacter violaceus]|uniref:Gsl1937 protein n=1 Tax=Gloeobacter violaceus (strain ATCC 29082 / PCC 7421) TaxID=251221 RepID=Q7NJ95_GLOVI|nr:acyl carrier protein [Gloeobacter violaceus]BAC89878.1 gsl1937 [Gloeobacter violaceus PCC 7421]
MTDIPVSQSAIAEWMKAYIGDFLNVDAQQVDVQTDFERFGLDSAIVVSLISELEEWLELELSPALLFEYPTIDSMAEHLYHQKRQAALTQPVQP